MHSTQSDFPDGVHEQNDVACLKSATHNQMIDSSTDTAETSRFIDKHPCLS